MGEALVRISVFIADGAAQLLGFEAGGFRLVEGDELVLAGEWGDRVMLRARLGPRRRRPRRPRPASSASTTR
jgi:hypothetical protein